MEDINTILADVQKEGTDPFADMEDTPSESLPENVQEEDEKIEEVVKEEAIPFHQHPRWIERERELQELRERDEIRAKELADLKTARETSTDTAIPDWFVELYGDNQVAYQKYNDHKQAELAELETRILARQQEAEERAVKEEEKWNNWVEEEISKLESSGHTFDRNKLIKIMLDYSPTDANNNLSFDKGIGIYNALESKTVDTSKADARKQLADTATKSTVKGDPAPKDYMTPAELRNRSMMSL